MDQVTQSNAAGAEQTAAAAEQMDAQASNLKVQVAVLREIIGRSSNGTGATAGIQSLPDNPTPRVRAHAQAHVSQYRRSARSAHALDPSQAIPMPGDRPLETRRLPGS